MNNRPIKFRAWDTQGKTMVDWNTMCQTAFNRGDVQMLYQIMTEPRFIKLQFTSLLDKNGKEIYEGDVVRMVGSKLAYKIRWNSYKFEMITEEGYNISGLELHKHVEVIGNIYENEDLLK